MQEAQRRHLQTALQNEQGSAPWQASKKPLVDLPSAEERGVWSLIPVVSPVPSQAVPCPSLSATAWTWRSAKNGMGFHAFPARLSSFPSQFPRQAFSPLNTPLDSPFLVSALIVARSPYLLYPNAPASLLCGYALRYTVFLLFELNRLSRRHCSTSSHIPPCSSHPHKFSCRCHAIMHALLRRGGAIAIPALANAGSAAGSTVRQCTGEEDRERERS